MRDNLSSSLPSGVLNFLSPASRAGMLRCREFSPGHRKTQNVACQGDIVLSYGLAPTSLPSAHSMVERARTKSTHGAEFLKKIAKKSISRFVSPEESAVASQEFKRVASCFRNQRRDLSLRNSRGDKSAIELFVAGVSVWEARLQRSVGRFTDGNRGGSPYLRRGRLHRAGGRA